MSMMINRYIVGPVVIAKGEHSDGLNESDLQKVTPVIQATMSRVNAMTPKQIDDLCRSIYDNEQKAYTDSLAVLKGRGVKVLDWNPTSR